MHIQPPTQRLMPMRIQGQEAEQPGNIEVLLGRRSYCSKVCKAKHRYGGPGTWAADSKDMSRLGKRCLAGRDKALPKFRRKGTLCVCTCIWYQVFVAVSAMFNGRDSLVAISIRSSSTIVPFILTFRIIELAW